MQPQTTVPIVPSVLHIYAGKLFDSTTGASVPNQVITVDKLTGRIHSVRDFKSFPEASTVGHSEDVVDLRRLTVVPGFVDVHVHLFLHPYSETSWDDQLTKESLVERTIRATVHAKKTLMAGFTTVRDLGTEGAEDADLSLRKCINQGIIPGPRYFCANRAIVPTGAYGPKGSIHMNTEGIEGITGAEVVDGETECIKAVRRQVGAGADWIKIYADYRCLSRLQFSSPSLASLSLSTFTPTELNALISTSHSYTSPFSRNGRPLVRVAVHATNHSTIAHLLHLGVDSVEHGSDMFGSCTDDEVAKIIDLFAISGATWVPTLSAYYTLGQGTSGLGGQNIWERAVQTFKIALRFVEGSLDAEGSNIDDMDDSRIKIAVGGDTGVFSHGDNALEMKLMVRLGARWQDVLRWATVGGWMCITGNDLAMYQSSAGFSNAEVGLDMSGENETPFGAILPGWTADIVGLRGDLDEDFEGTIEKVDFVMKAGQVYKLDGKCTV